MCTMMIYEQIGKNPEDLCRLSSNQRYTQKTTNSSRNEKICFTVGHTKNYLKSIEENGIIRKQGKTENYKGGSVFQTIEKAQRWLKKNNKDSIWSVFGIKADYYSDAEDTGEDYRRLLVNSEIFLLDEIIYE